jgi:hypothetical protein
MAARGTHTGAKSEGSGTPRRVDSVAPIAAARVL